MYKPYLINVDELIKILQTFPGLGNDMWIEIICKNLIERPEDLVNILASSLLASLLEQQRLNDKLAKMGTEKG